LIPFQNGPNSNHLILELCAYNIQSCRIADRAGAGRIELCSNPSQGGVTPSYGLVKYALEHISIPVFPMIRPRGGGFVYDADEVAIMKKDILLCRDMGCVGIATGVQLATGGIDTETMKHIVEWAYPMEVTCHKVFDVTPDGFQSLEDLIAAGCKRILTSGLQKTAVDGASMLSQLVAVAAGRITIMPGGSVRSSNITQLVQETGAKEFHSSGLTGQSQLYVADQDEVREMAGKLKH